MRGAQQLLDLRRAGSRPFCVWLHDDDFPVTSAAARDWLDQPNAFDDQRHAVIRFEASDIPEALDLRCLVGLTVHVTSERGAQRHQRIFDAAAAANAAVVLAVINNEVVVHHRATEQAHG